MKKILVAYTTNSGSTTEVAQAVAEELGKNGDAVEVRRIEELTGIAGYDAVVVGAPMILGWSRTAQNFLKKHQAALSRVPVAYFCTAMSLTQTEDFSSVGLPVTIDPWLPAQPKNPARLSIKENYATLSNYLRPILKAAPSVKPVSIGFFGGKLELFRLKFLQMLFVMVVIHAQPGDLRNWDAIHAWGAELRAKMGGEVPVSQSVSAL